MNLIQFEGTHMSKLDYEVYYLIDVGESWG